MDHINVSALQHLIIHTLENYSDEIHQPHTHAFYTYILSLSSRLEYTLDITIGTLSIHYIIYTHTLTEENTAILQILSLLYIHPLCTITIYVEDTMWFIRHHYMFYTILVNTGYIHYDIMDPDSPSPHNYDPKSTSHTRSYVYIRSRYTTTEALISGFRAVRGHNSDPDIADTDCIVAVDEVYNLLFPSHTLMTILLPIGMVPTTPYSILEYYYAETTLIPSVHEQYKSDSRVQRSGVYTLPYDATFPSVLSEFYHKHTENSNTTATTISKTTPLLILPSPPSSQPLKHHLKPATSADPPPSLPRTPPLFTSSQLYALAARFLGPAELAVYGIVFDRKDTPPEATPDLTLPKRTLNTTNYSTRDSTHNISKYFTSVCTIFTYPHTPSPPDRDSDTCKFQQGNDTCSVLEGEDEVEFTVYSVSQTISWKAVVSYMSQLSRCSRALVCGGVGGGGGTTESMYV